MCLEIACLTDGSEYSFSLYQLKNDVQEHHDSNKAFQVKFVNNVLEEFGNPFLNSSSDLRSFGTNKLGRKEHIKCLYEIKVTSKQQFKEY